MRIALYAGDTAIGTIHYPREKFLDPHPWRVDVTGPLQSPIILQFQATMVWLPQPSKHITRAYVATPADAATDAVMAAALAGADIPGVPPQHRPAFAEALKALLHAKG